MVGEKVRELREKRSLTTNELGKLAGITRQTVENIENGRVSPRLDTLEKIFQALGYKSLKRLINAK